MQPTPPSPTGVRALTAKGVWHRYSPLLLLGIIQLVIVLVVPSIAPGSAALVGAGAGVVSGTGAGGGAAGSVAGTGQSAAGTAGGTGSAGTAGGGAGAAGAASGGGAAGSVGSVAAGGHVGSCPGTQPAPWAYMPPCLTFTGTNGAASMPGVTPTEIRYVWFEGVVPAAVAAIGSESGLSYTPQQLCEAMVAYTKVLNKRWQLYGRHFVPLDGPGSHSGMAQGSSACRTPYYQADNCGASDSACFRAQADVIASMNPAPAFVITSTEGPAPLLDELSRHHILTLGQPSADSFAEPHAPYIWDWQMSAENASSFGSEYFCRKLVGKPVQYAGPEVLASGANPTQPPVRKIAIVHDTGVPDTLTPGANDFISKITKCGASGVGSYPFPADLTTLAQDMQTVAAKIKLGGYTTVYVYMDFIAAIDLSNDLDAEAWHPEMVISGMGAMDDDRLAQLANPNTWRYAFGLSLTKYSAYGNSSDYYTAYKDSGATDEPFKLASAMWQYFWLAGDMFQVAGPAPTLTSIQTGMYAMPYLGGQPTHAGMKWGTPGDRFLGQQDVGEVWYCPTQQTPENGQPGTYVGVEDSRRFQHGQFDAAMRVFPSGVCAP